MWKRPTGARRPGQRARQGARPGPGPGPGSDSVIGLRLHEGRGAGAFAKIMSAAIGWTRSAARREGRPGKVGAGVGGGAHTEEITEIPVT